MGLTPCYTRSSSLDEIANVNFLSDDIVYALQNIINSLINSATDLRRYVLERRFTKVSEITQCNGQYANVNTNSPPILHRFQVMADYWSNFR